jgi:hypothetical protein
MVSFRHTSHMVSLRMLLLCWVCNWLSESVKSSDIARYDTETAGFADCITCPGKLLALTLNLGVYEMTLCGDSPTSLHPYTVVVSYKTIGAAL